jgi:hypothetical protein
MVARWRVDFMRSPVSKRVNSSRAPDDGLFGSAVKFLQITGTAQLPKFGAR